MNHDPNFLLTLYRQLLLPRLIEEKMLLLLRQGRVSKWFSGIGQEAVSVGVTAALRNDDEIFPLMRNLGVFTTRGVPLAQLFAQFQGSGEGFTKGRDRSFHFGTRPHHIIGMISHLGPQLSVADGAALGHLLANDGRICAAFSGDGGTSQGEFHEALNVAAVWSLPVIFIVEQNGWALSTPPHEQYRCTRLSDRALGYGMEGKTIDGNDVLAVYAAVSAAARELREAPRPLLIECVTYRMRGHEEASGIAYVPPEQLSEWKKQDPISRFETVLQHHGVLNAAAQTHIRAELLADIELALEEGFAKPSPVVDPARELADVYAAPRPLRPKPLVPHAEPVTKRFVDAVSDGLREAMRHFPDLVIMGQDVGRYGGVFKVTEGMIEEFGPDRVRNTPLCESAIVGIGLGLSLGGRRSVIEMQFSDFVSCGFNQIVNNLAKVHYRWSQNADVTIRLPTGAGVRAGPFHSQSTEAWFFHVPGLKLVYPSNPDDAKALLLAAIDDPNPVLFFEHKALYRSVDGPVTPGWQPATIGEGHRIRLGTDASIVTYGLGVHWAIQLQEAHPEWSLDIVDLRSLLPWDHSTVRESVQATGRVLVLHEDTLTGGIGAEIAAWIGEHCFSLLDAPVMRIGSLDTPVPFAALLEDQFLAKAKLEAGLQSLLNY